MSSPFRSSFQQIPQTTILKYFHSLQSDNCLATLFPEKVCYGTLYCVLCHFVVTPKPHLPHLVCCSITIPCKWQTFFGIISILKDNVLFAAWLSSYGGIKTVYCDRQHQRWHLFQMFAPNQTRILQDRGRFHISPIFQMKLNFLVKSAGSNPRGRAEKMWVDIRGNEFKLRTRVLRISASIPVNHKLKVVAFKRLP